MESAETAAVLSAAATDYRMLLDKGYPERASLKLVGDRFRLPADSRMILFRGMLDQAASVANFSKLVTAPPKESMSAAVDGYNVLLTLLNYRLGRPLFRCSDGFIRDAGGLHGAVRNLELFTSMMELLVGYLFLHRLESCTIYLDAPVSHSREHAFLLLKLLESRSVAADPESGTRKIPDGEAQNPGQEKAPSEHWVISPAAAGRLGADSSPETRIIRCNVELSQCPDAALIRSGADLLATSDSQIVSRSQTPVWDLAHAILKTYWNFNPRIDLFAGFSDAALFRSGTSKA